MARRFAFSLPPTTSVVNYFSSGGISQPSLLTNRGVKLTSGAGTANTLADILSVTGAGECPFLIAYSNSAVPTHTVRCQVIVDGTTVFDATSDSIASTASRGVVVVDAVHGAVSGAIPTGVPIRFNSSLIVRLASSQSGADYTALTYQLNRY